MKELSEFLSYDPVRDVLKIHGVCYARELFEHLGLGSIGAEFRIMQREDGNLTLQSIEPRAEANEFKIARLCLTERDVLVLKVEQAMSDAAVKRVQEYFGPFVPSRRVMVLADGMDVAVLSEEQLPSAAPEGKAGASDWEKARQKLEEWQAYVRNINGTKSEDPACA